MDTTIKTISCGEKKNSPAILEISVYIFNLDPRRAVSKGLLKREEKKK